MNQRNQRNQMKEINFNFISNRPTSLITPINKQMKTSQPSQPTLIDWKNKVRIMASQKF